MKNRKLRGLLILLVLGFILAFVAPMLIPGIPTLPFVKDKKLNLGLDLQGGMQILLEVDFTEVEIPNEEKEEAVKTALEIIRNRIDEFGIAEPTIQRIGTSNRIMIQLPGEKNFDRAKELIGKTAKLEFKLLASEDKISDAYTALDNYLKDNYKNYSFLAVEEIVKEEAVDVLATEEDEDIEEEEVTYFSDLLSYEGGRNYIAAKDVKTLKTLIKDPDFLKNVPAGIQIAVEKENKKNPYAGRTVYFLQKKSELSGEYLEKAQQKTGQGYTASEKGPYVSLTFTKKGAKIFANVTGQNVNKRLAIVLDNVVYVAPNIKGKIPSGQASITGGFSFEEVQDLVIVLNAGNLPAPVNIVEERTVGASLGKDSIKSGIMAALLGLALVVVFMFIYYGLSGLIADIAVVINIGFILAIMSLLQGTLTMPGIAGMILTIGMAVDANVIIFERIRENLKQGKTIRSAVDGGFSRAMVTIIDANITTLITALVLYQFGTGAIKGFAVTLSIGIVGSMFASIIMVKAIFDSMVTNVNRSKLSI